VGSLGVLEHEFDGRTRIHGALRPIYTVKNGKIVREEFYYSM